ncbi:MAG: DMT family transporter [Polaromonas sp.]|jgi:drug/metabolite transporter (DMT)-like permease|nr:DMT family transporter [Polaromonas sp.]MBK9340713.1 DMT family transporter [Rhodoferax sp.]MBK7026107.1 DMT family transporter [Polaromonas sp.]MBK7502380.1 DMT family transporter [Polaromonas sp.]MBL0253229.1 DMT family transporter [Polaromonas sp.]
MKKSVYVEFILLAAIWGSSFLFTRIAAVEFGVMPTAFLRVLLAALFLMPFLLWSGHWPAFKKRAGPIMFVGMLNSGIPFALYAYAVMSITTGLSAILNATVPLFGAIVAWLWLKDKPTNSRIMGLVIGFIGVALLAGDQASFKPGGSGWAILACLVATTCYAISASYTRKYLMGVPPMATSTGSMIGAALGLSVPALLSWPSSVPSLQAWGSVLFVAILCTGVAYVLYFRLIEAAGPSKTLTVTFMIPVFAIVYGVLFLGEELTLWMIVCACVIICGTALATGLVKIKALR